MPLRLLWQPRHPRDVDVPFVLEIIDYDKRYEVAEEPKRWSLGVMVKRWVVEPAFSRWVIMEVRRYVWRKEGREE